MADTPLESAEQIFNLIDRHNRNTTIATPMYGDRHVEDHPDFYVGVRLARSAIPIDSTTGERMHDLDFDLANTVSPRFTRLTRAIDQAAQAAANRRFNP